MNPRIAFCTTCKNRTQHLRLTLPKNIEENADYENLVLVVLDYSSNDDLLDFIAAEHAADVERGRVVVYSLPGRSQFHMAHAKNVAHRCGIAEGAEILVNMDADNYAGKGFAQYVADHIKHSNDYLAIGKMVKGVTPRGVTGRICVHKEAFLRAGGYDERFGTWSPDDKDFDHRLRRMGCNRMTIDDRFMFCVRHNDKMRFREYPHVRQVETHSNELLVQEATHTVVNFGDFGCGTVYRNGLALEAVADANLRDRAT